MLTMDSAPIKTSEEATETIKNKEFILQQYSGGALSHVHMSTRTQFHDSYRDHLKSYMQKHMQQQPFSYGASTGSYSTKYSQVFKERQTSRLMDKLRSVKGTYDMSYHQLKVLHQEIAHQNLK